MLISFARDISMVSIDLTEYHTITLAKLCFLTHLSIALDSVMCPVCKITEISTVLVDEESLPIELHSFFTPVTQQIEVLNSANKFQITGMDEKIKFQKKTILKLQEKVKKQKEFLFAAKEEIIQMANYKSQADKLQRELNDLKQQIKDGKQRQSQKPTELSMILDDTPYATGRTSNNQVNNSLFNRDMQQQNTLTWHPQDCALNKFINNVQQQFETRRTKETPETTATAVCSAFVDPHIVQLQQNDQSLQQQHQNQYQYHSQHDVYYPFSRQLVYSASTSFGEPNANRSTLFSSGTTTSTLASSRSNLQKSRLNKLGKLNTRSLTSQLATRITANMKMGRQINTNYRDIHISNHSFKTPSTSSSSFMGKGPILNHILQKSSDTSSEYFLH